jgi:hypothetical protein
MIKTVAIELRGKELNLETGKMARQADGSLLPLRRPVGNCGEQQDAKRRDDFFSLTMITSKRRILPARYRADFSRERAGLQKKRS